MQTGLGLAMVTASASTGLMVLSYQSYHPLGLLAGSLGFVRSKASDRLHGP